ncbi:MAG: prenyltransferase/squalene oxidase repeat-containing protein [Planctomycetota bacterium]
MPDQGFPELVQQRSHVPGMEEPKTFEETLRELLKSSPYLVISVVVHFVVILLFATADPPEEIDPDRLIKASAEEIEEQIPPPPPPPEPEIEKVEEIIEEPTISEDEAVEELLEYEDVSDSKGEFDSTGLNDVIGVGGGGGSGFGKLGGRRGGGKRGGEAINRAVEDGLMWLANHQSPEGFWSCAAFDTECGKQGDDVICDGTGSPQFDVGVTGLSLLAFLGAGYTHKEGKHKKTVKAGLRFLVDVQQRDGNFGIETNLQYTYDHMIATLAMVEAYALTKDYMFKKSAEKSLEYMYKIRNPGAAWRYAPAHSEMVTHPNDMSVTGWAILVMTLAKEYDMDLDETALEDSLLFLEEMTDPISGRTGYYDMGGPPPRELGKDTTWPAEQTESMTAVGVLCRIFADPDLTRPGNQEMVDKGVELITRLPPVWDPDDPGGRKDFYFWYYGTYALYQYGGQAWKDWEKTLVPNIADHQHREGELKGSWDPHVDPWGGVGGRVYSTALLVLCMEVFSRYDTVMGAH